MTANNFSVIIYSNREKKRSKNEQVNPQLLTSSITLPFVIHARNKLIVICLTTLNKFVTVAKLLVVKLNTTQRITSPARIPILDLIVCITDKFFQFLFSIIVTLFPLSQTP